MRKSADPLLPYKKKRDFEVTPEPVGGVSTDKPVLSYVIQKHDARSHHYDFRLELEGVLKSWAVPKGPSLDPAQKRLAVKTEDHPLEYREFEGVIPSGQYGAGTMIIWDRGTWEPIGEAGKGLQSGHLKFRLNGTKLQGNWVLVRMQGKAGEKQENWLLIKEKDDEAQVGEEKDVVDQLPGSVLERSEDPLIPALAKPGPVPPQLAPQLATLVDKIPTDGDWSYEIKFDGYRILAHFADGEVSLFTRNGNNWTHRLGNLAAELRRLKVEPGWLDGEIVILGVDGTPDFAALQNAFESSRVGDIIYFIFDIPFYAGFDLRAVPLVARRELLKKVLSLAESGQIKFSDEFVGSGQEILQSACQMGLEGIMGKRRDSGYVSSRSANWIKLKCDRRQEFVVAGYTESKAAGRDIGALLVAYYDEEGHLRYAGKVGTGFDNKTLSMLKKKLSALAMDETPLHEKPRDVKGHWVLPQLVAEVSFAEWTKDDRLRQAVYHGLREDLPASAVTRESVPATPRPMPPRQDRIYSKKVSPPVTSEYKITHPERIIDPESGLKKQDLAEYYLMAAPFLLPHLKDRPVSFLRAPSGVNGELFFQKHAETLHIPDLKRLDPALNPSHPAMIEVDSIKALMGAVQMNVIEFHTWNSTTNKINYPDRMVLDLDPGEGVDWSMMQQAAELTRTLLEELGLCSYLKTSGGKGLHIVVPLTPRDDWDTVRDFAKAVSQHLAAVLPDRFAPLSGPRNRVGKIFVDYIRNNKGATTAAAFSVRARPGMGVSVPCSWAELPNLTGGDHWKVSTIAERLESGQNPWAEYGKTRQTIKAKNRKLLKV